LALLVRMKPGVTYWNRPRGAGKLGGPVKIDVQVMDVVTRIGLSLLVAVSLAACGLKGPLVLPDKKPVAAMNKPQPDVEQTKKSK
jgi:predicted small lipoprotein YifL